MNFQYNFFWTIKFSQYLQVYAGSELNLKKSWGYGALNIKSVVHEYVTVYIPNFTKKSWGRENILTLILKIQGVHKQHIMQHWFTIFIIMKETCGEALIDDIKTEGRIKIKLKRKKKQADTRTITFVSKKNHVLASNQFNIIFFKFQCFSFQNRHMYLFYFTIQSMYVCFTCTFIIKTV